MVKVIPPYGYGIKCGNGIVDSGETCDSGNFDGRLCTDFDAFTGGYLECVNCQIDTSNCNDVSVCGDGNIDDGELCDDGNLDGFSCTSFGNFTGGSLSCSDSCVFDTSNCVGSPGGSCGDGTINNGEMCDGNDLSGYLCSDFDNFLGGGLSCDNCAFDTSQCSLTSTCGNGIIDNGEECDSGIGNFICEDFDGYTGGTLSCNSSCMFDLSQCTGGVTPAVCGNGIVEENETCDNGNFTGLLCTNFKGFTGGFLSCGSDCHIDTSNCNNISVCGDGELNAGEQCDVGIGNFNCTMFDGHTGGILSCDQNCMFNLSQCDGGSVRDCGNNVADGNETCDGIDLNGFNCNNFNSFNGGSLDCTDSCDINTSACYIISCGDGNCDSPIETCSNCPSDCGQCSTGGGSGGGGGGGCTPKWECTEWGPCRNNVQTRTCVDLRRCRTVRNKPIENQTCICQEDWICDEWTKCGPDGTQTRNCGDWNDCGTTKLRPALEQDCEYIPPVIVITATCYDGIRNQGEVDIDCGGPCKPCPSCNDGIKNQGETGIDCGGLCEPCPEVPKGLSWWFIILLLLIIIILIGSIGFGTYYYWPQINTKLQEMTASHKIGEPKELLEVEKYAQRMENEGYSDQQIVRALKKSGWNEEQIHMVMHKVHKPTGNLVNMVDYIKKCRRLGYSDDKTKLMLLKVGWPAVQISKVFEMKAIKKE